MCRGREGGERMCKAKEVYGPWRGEEREMGWVEGGRRLVVDGVKEFETE